MFFNRFYIFSHFHILDNDNIQKLRISIVRRKNNGIYYQ